MTTPLAVVTGAASGIGLALCLELSARGFDVVAIDRDAIPIAGRPGIAARQGDVGDAAAMQVIADEFGARPAHYVFANAGIGARGQALGASPEAWQRAWATNAMGPLNTLRSWWPALARGRGRAVVTVSVAALLVYPGATLYRATKSALLAALEGLYYETRGSGVALHALCPGMVKSNIVANARQGDEALPDDPFAQYLAAAMRNAEPAEDFARRVLDGLEAGDAPFYWLTHPAARPMVEQRHHGLLVSGRPGLEFGVLP